MSSRPKTDEVFIRRMAEILRLMRRRTDNQTSTPTAGAQSSTTQNIKTISDNSALNNQTPSTSANIEQSQDFSEPSYATPISPQIDDESDIAAAAHLELPNAQSILLTCIDFVLRSKYGCSRALTPEEERDRNGWPFKPKLNSVIVEYYFRLKLTFGLLVISDRNGHYVFVQNIKKAFEYKVFCLDRVFIPTLDIFENDETGTENLIKFKVELNKYTGIFDFVVSSLVDEFIMKSRRTQVEFCRDAVEFDASQNTKKVKFNEDVENEYGEESAFVLQIIGRIYYKSERNIRGADALRKSLKICPYLWQSYKELCDHGEKPDPNKVFQVIQNDTSISCQNSFNVGSNNLNGHVENIVFNSNNSSTPVQTLGLIVNNSMSGIRQFTPDESQFSLLRAPAAASKPNKYRNLYGLSPLSPSFGVLPLDSSPAEGYVISPSGTLPENDDQKIIPKRQLLARKETITPLQVAKPVVFSQSGNTALVTNTPNITASAPLRRSSRVTNNNYNVKENNKSPKFTSPKSPSRKTKLLKSSKNSKTTFGDFNEKNKHEIDTSLSIQSACQQVLALQKQSMEGLMSLLRNFGKAYLYLAHYDLNKALEAFLDLPMPQQNTSLVMSYCGKAHVALHQYKEAIRYFEKVREKEPYRDSMMEIYSTALWHLHKEKDLSSLAHDLLQCDRYSPSTWSVAGNCVSLHKEHDVAIKFFERAVQLDPDFAYAHTLLGHEFVITEELDKAMTCYRHAIRVDPRLYNAWYGLGSIYYKQEKYQLAEIHYKKALSIHPTSAVIMCHIGVVQNALQKPFTALDTLNEALQIHPKSALCKFHRANLYFHSGRYQEALQELQELQELVPKESSVFYLTGKVHKKLGNDHLSLMYISWATDLDPKGANSQVREASDPLINNSVVPDIGGVLSPTGDQPAEGTSTEALTTPAQASITEPVDMDETL